MQERRSGTQRPQRRHPPGGPTGYNPRRAQNGSSLGNANRNYQRYIELAGDAARRGDPIEVENCYQHAEHYFRVMRESERERGER